MPITFNNVKNQIRFNNDYYRVYFDTKNRKQFPAPVPFAEASEELIAQVIKYGHKTDDGSFAVWRDGKEEKWWNIGDKRPVSLSDGQTTYLRIIGFEFDDLANGGGGKAKITCDFENLLDVGIAPEPADNYLELNIRTGVLALKDKLPLYLQNLMVPCVKYDRETPITDDIVLVQTKNIGSTLEDNYPYYSSLSRKIKKPKGGKNTSYLLCDKTNTTNAQNRILSFIGFVLPIDLPYSPIGTYAAPIIFLHSN